MKSLMVLAFSLMTTGVMAEALPVIDFGIVFPTSGTLSFDGTNWVGTDIEVDNVGALIGITPISPVPVVGGLLNFDSESGEITITGGVPAAEIPEDSTLMLGEITSAQAVNNVLVVTFRDNKNEKLIDFFQMPQSAPGGGEIEFTYSGYFGLTYREGDLAPLSGDVVNSPVPEPFTLLLMGAGLVGLGIARRKRS